ncbi:MAG: hypothetical protein WBB59_16890 [Candidatus Microthrix parvicella]|jgi:hypothetical protein|uniref:hypothetical protein n=1 Tax=Candidatus Neomicrothrix sp. TaxID=2719034 RepID=UPI001B5C7A31|nr:hypothetical protein [Candidatus Microthrix sp.]MBK7323809.1 hypothetical protein [Candidatus Microthrix sp.]MBP7988933.1 hypothetical protein [Candidatus Microthrix sp.]MBP7994193.1 hypothetical protein [Candidatus Microthrix sp.]
MIAPTFGSPTALKRGLVAASAVGLLLLSGCGDSKDSKSDAKAAATTEAAAGGSTTSAAGTSKTTAPGDAAKGDDEPIKVTGNSVKDFCDTLAKVANQSEGAQDYKPLQESAPDEIKPVVDDLAKAAEEAQTADAPSADLQERGTRAVVGVTVFALNECGDTAGLAEAIGIDDAAAKMLSKYTVDDVQDDATWEKIKAELQQG